MRRNALTLPVYLPILLLSFARGILIPILPVYAASFDVSYGLIGLAIASQGIGMLVGDLPAGILFNILGQRWAMLLGIGGAGLAMLIMGTAQVFPLVLVSGLLAGFAGALWNLSLHAYLTSAVSIDQRGRALAAFGGVMRIGIFAGPIIGGAVGAAYGLRAPFYLHAAVVMVAACLPAFFIKTRAGGPPQNKQGKGLRGHGGHLFDLMKKHYGVLLPAGAGQFFAMMIRSGREIVIPLYGADVLGLDVQAIGWVITLSSAIDMSLFYPAGLLMDRFGRKYAYVPSFLLQALGMGLIPLSSTFLGLLGATLIMGFGNGLGSGTMMTLGSDLAPKESTSEFLGIWRLIGDLGQTGAPIVMGNIADLLSLSAATLVIASFGLLAAATLGLLVPETLKKRPAPSQAPTT